MKKSPKTAVKDSIEAAPALAPPVNWIGGPDEVGVALVAGTVLGTVVGLVVGYGASVVVSFEPNSMKLAHEIRVLLAK
tara:strand:- start:536 stop:769 length:234 start_codon:yes stop_codon:yes gene_type:complete